MAGLVRRDPKSAESRDIFDRLDTLFDEWTQLLPQRMTDRLRSPMFPEPSMVLGDYLRVDEFREGDDLVIKAELPGVDPEKDVQISVTDHRLHIDAQRREEAETESKGYVRRELRYGHFTRDLPLPASVSESDVSARYRHGILEIRVHVPESEATTIPIEKA
ncbi:Hsp20/alpha crystallin family protein [Egicoccus sp. AB-alg2]|uniref:Hsp20/alpha crystallin family protein n=1 Tax=Egicoccus sp. AB-alg2 TaxID=3242693 RepID=UPI00359DEC7C